MVNDGDGCCVWVDCWFVGCEIECCKLTLDSTGVNLIFSNEIRDLVPIHVIVICDIQAQWICVFGVRLCGW